MTQEVQRWLRQNALPLKSLHLDASDDDLRPLHDVLRDVRILGLGEATHGTAEFFRLKHRLLRFLVRDMGFTALAMEASASAAQAVNDYVLHGIGDPAETLAGLGFWTWRTREMLAVIEWMRDHNRTASREHAVRFIGIDPQRCGPSLTALSASLRTMAPERAEILGGPLGTLVDAKPGSRAVHGTHVLSQARELVRFLEEHKPELTERAGPERVDRALGHARMIAEAADVATRPLHGDADTQEAGALATRDRYMADAVISLEERSPGKVAVWAHNGHVSAGHYAANVPAMGQHLRKHYGERYYALGLLFGKGAFRARPGNSATRRPRSHKISAAGPRSVEAQLAAATPEDHLIDLRSARAQPAVQQWLHDQQFVRAFGASVPRVTYRFHMTPTVLGREYDGLAYVASSTASELLP